MKKPLLIKLAIVAIAIVAFAVLFMRSIEDTRSEAYSVEKRHMRPWSLALEGAPRAGDALLVLRPPGELAHALFQQIFARAMESLNSPAAASVPVVLRGEYDRVVGDQLTEDALLAAARAAGIDAAALSPRCLVHRRISEPGGVRQAYFIFFEAPAVLQFRRQLGLDAESFSPVMAVAGAGADFNAWLPMQVNAEADCLAPVEVVP